MATPWTPSSALARAVYAAGFTYDPDQDIIVARMDALQRNFGYAYGYDAAALGVSFVIDCEPIFFDYDNKHWMIELWKGQYGLETGCEVGVYTRPIGSTGPGYALLDATVGQRPGDGVASHNLFYDCADDGDRLQLKATLNRDGQALFTRGPERHWWLTSFKWGVFSNPSQLSLDVAITLKDIAMRRAFMGGIAGRPYPNLKVNRRTVSFTFDQPYAVPQPPRPAPVLAAVNAWNQQIVSRYNALGFPNNDPNQVQAEFLSVAGLGLLRLADNYGLTVCQLAVQTGQSLATVVTGLVDGLTVAASTVVAWCSGAGQAFGAWVSVIQNYLGLPLDFSCYVEIDNTKGASDLVLTGSSANLGSYVVGPPTWIRKGTVARLILQDPKPSPFGSQGSVSYSYADASLAMKSVTFSYEDPTGPYPNKASSSQADWVTLAKSGDPNGAWSTSVPSGGHPLFVRYVIGGGQTQFPWSHVGNTAGFGNMADGRPIWTADFSGDGREDVLFFYPGDHNWWLGRLDSGQFAWSHIGNTAGFGQVADGRPIWTGRFSAPDRREVLFYYPGDHNWWLGHFDGGQLVWNHVGNTAGFGNLTRSGIRFFTGDFSGDGREDVLFYHAGDHNWWRGSHGGGQLHWGLSGNTAGFGNLTRSGIRFFTGDFSRGGRDDVLFYYAGDHNWWLGRQEGGQLAWSHVGNTAGFGNLTRSGIRFFTGDFSGDGRDDVLFYYAGDGNWWLGSHGGGQLHWGLSGNSTGFGNLTRPSIRFFTGDFSGDGRDDVLFYHAGDHNWWLGHFDSGQLAWRLVGNTAGFGNMADGRPIWTGGFSADGRDEVLFFYPGDHNWWLGRPADVVS